MSPYQQTDKMLRKCRSRALGIPSSHINILLGTTSNRASGPLANPVEVYSSFDKNSVILIADLISDPTIYCRMVPWYLSEASLSLNMPSF